MVLGKSAFDPEATCVLIQSSSLTEYEVPGRGVENLPSFGLDGSSASVHLLGV